MKVEQSSSVTTESMETSTISSMLSASTMFSAIVTPLKSNNKKLTAAEIQKNYRQRKYDNSSPDERIEHKKKCADRQKEYRKQLKKRLSLEEWQKRKELLALKQKKRRERKKKLNLYHK